MKIWLDAQLSPQLASWIQDTFKIEAMAVRDVGLRDATNRDIFIAAKKSGAVVMSKDADFVVLLEQEGPPPQIVWVTCGNSSNEHLKSVLKTYWSEFVEMLKAGETLIEVSDSRSA